MQASGRIDTKRRLRSLLSALCLTVYLASVCGYSISVLTCSCISHRHSTQCSCCACHHETTGFGFHATRHCCSHNHSTEISLYDFETDDNGKCRIMPYESYAHTPSLALDTPKSGIFLLNDYGRSSVPKDPPVALFALRAPPAYV